jgi:nickel/cobalt exporter
MDDFSRLLQQGTLHAWLYIPTAMLLGALHGMEPGHSKTMMAAFIIAIRGTVLQAVILGLCAAFSHSLVIWLLAGLALHYGGRWNAESAEPYFQLGSAGLIIGLALWMAWRTHREIKAEARHGHDHEHEHGHGHSHDTGLADYQDAHELAHATDIRKRFAGGTATYSQIALFGFTGGLLPCPAAFTLVLVCLQLKRVALGIAMVLAFSAGLAFTLVATGALAAWSLRHAERRFGGLGSVARKLPYLSSAILTLIGLFIGVQGWLHLASRH